MAYEHIRPHFMNITEDKLWGGGAYLCLSVTAHMCRPEGCLCARVPLNNVH